MTQPRLLLDPARKGRDAEMFERDLRKRVVGQEEAIREMVDAYQTWAAGMGVSALPRPPRLALLLTARVRCSSTARLSYCLTARLRW